MTAPAVSSSPPDVRWRWALPLILAAAALARLAFISSESYWFDEIWSVRQVRLPFVDMLASLADKDVHPPLYSILLWGWTRLLGEAEWATRLLSALFGLGAVGVGYLLGRDLFDRRTGLLAAAIMAVNPFLVAFSQETRAYSLLLFNALLATWLLHRWAAPPRPAAPPVERARMLAYLSSAIVLAYTHVYGLFFLIFHGIWVLWRVPRLRLRMIGVACVIGLAFSPWLPVMLGQVRHVQEGFWIPPLDWIDPVKWAWYWSGYSIPLAVLFLGLVLYGARRAGSFVALWVAIPLGLPIAASLVGEPIFHHKYPIAVVAAFAILAARGLLRVSPRPRLILGLSLGALLLIALLRLQLRTDKEQYRELAALADAELRRGSVVVADAHAEPYLSFYMTQPGARWLHSAAELDAAEAQARARGAALVFLLAHPTHSDLEAALHARQEPAETRSFHLVKAVRYALGDAWLNRSRAARDRRGAATPAGSPGPARRSASSRTRQSRPPRYR